MMKTTEENIRDLGSIIKLILKLDEDKIMRDQSRKIVWFSGSKIRVRNINNLKYLSTKAMCL
jgi:hypothetical protein